MPKTSGDPSVRATQTEGRTARAERAAVARADRERKAKRAKVRNLGVIGVVVVLVAVVAVVLATRTSGSANASTPPGLTAGQGVAIGSGPVDVTIYEDFQCPICKNLEQTDGAGLTKVSAPGGGATVHYVPVSILDSPTSDYSTRAANAAYCAPVDRFKAFHDLLYTNQPAEGGTGLTNAQIISYAKQAGISGSSFTDCVQNGRYTSFVQAQTTAFTNAMQKAKTTPGTPGVFVDGKWAAQDWQKTPDYFTAIVAQEAAKKTASPSPTN